MPLGTLRICRKCLMTQQAAAHQHCDACGSELVPLLEEKSQSTRGPCIVGCVKEKTCQRCGTTFKCQSGGCWCNNIQLSSVTLARLESQYDGCLCPECLASFSIG